MIFDKEVMWADKDPFSSTNTVDLAPAFAPGDFKSGPGEVIIVHTKGHNLVTDGGNLYYIDVESSIDDVIFGPEMRVYAGPQALANTGVSFGLSSVVSRIIRISLSGFVSGTWTCGVVLGVYK